MFKNRALKIQVVKNEKVDPQQIALEHHIITQETQELVKDLVDYVGVRALIGTAAIFALTTLSKVIVKSTPTG